MFTNQISSGLMDNLINTLVTVVLGGVAVGWLTHNWTNRQKEQKARVSLAQDFASAYGEFFVIWKLWNAYREFGSASFPEASRWALMERAGHAEATVEALLVSLAFTRELDSGQQEVLARFRQGFQTLRECIKDNKPVPWTKDDDPQYRTFKTLMVEVGALVIGKTSYKNAYAAWLEITRNDYESPHGSKRWDRGPLPRDRT